MTGETNLTVLLQMMHPILAAEDYVFCTVQPDNLGAVQPIGLFHEVEGVTLILRRDQAEMANLAYEAVFRMITLSVHSSLEAVGFLAAITSKLADRGISVNPVSAYYHDHLFVPADRAEEAMMILQSLRES